MIYYEVFWVDNDNNEDLIYNPDSASEGRVISAATLTLSVNDASSFKFTIHKQHPLYSKITPFNGVIRVYETVNNGARKIKFNGKVIGAVSAYNLSNEITCKGGLGWLEWTYFSRYLNTYPKYVRTDDFNENAKRKKEVFRTGKFDKNSSPAVCAQFVINTHNWQMRANTEGNGGTFETPKDISETYAPGVFKIAECHARQNPYGIDVKVTDETENEGVYITRNQTSLTTCADWFKNELAEKCEANIVVDEETNEIHIYGEVVPIDNSQEIRLEENLIGYSRQLDFKEVPTVFLPIGKSVSSHGTMYTKDQETGSISLNPDNSAYVITTIMDSGEQNEVWDISPVCYVTPYSTDMNQDNVQPLDPDNPPDRDSKYIKLIKYDGVKNKSGEVVVATNAEFKGGITFYLEPPFIVWKEGVEKYGRKIGQKQWSSATRTQLRAYGPAYFKKLIMSAETLEINAVDKGFIGTNIDKPVQLAKRYHVVSHIHGIDDWVPCTQIEINILNASQSRYSFKKAYKPFTYLFKKQKDKVNELSTQSTNPPPNIARILKDNGEQILEELD